MNIVLGHSKGGVGKSTICWNLAFAVKPARARIIDLDFQQTLYIVNEIRKQKMNDSLNILQPTTAEELISTLDDGYSGYTFIDLGGFDNDINRIALAKADEVIIPISDSITEQIGFKTFEAIIDELNLKNISIVLNNIHPQKKKFDEIKETISTLENANLLDTIIRTRIDYKKSMSIGSSVLMGENEKAKQEIKDLFFEIITKDL